MRLLVLLLRLALPARGETADLLLVLAADASGRVPSERFAVQQQGYAAAFRDPRLLRAIAGGPHQRIAVAMVHWTGPRMRALVVDWPEVADGGSATALAAGRRSAG